MNKKKQEVAVPRVHQYYRSLHIKMQTHVFKLLCKNFIITVETDTGQIKQV